ncbi:MAG: GNAT family N-acetyltransferase [Actinomycetota bacterium]
MAYTTESAVRLRPLNRGEDERMERLFYRLTPETIYRRFMTHYSDPQALRPLLDVDGHARVAVVAVDAHEEIVGVARYSRLTADPDTAEIAVVVQDDLQGRGIGLKLLVELREMARADGVRHFTGTMLAGNTACAKVVTRAFPGVVLRTTNGETSFNADLRARCSASQSLTRRGRKRAG